uniref:FCH domain-containing protein n=1 Tax=Spongospora subterranea TaxID=70186 RepID=A0A0H5QSX3_9EUKA|eukprot:CRZ05123.1 hypothetical protein [Spongospora subterranea]
MSLNVAVEQQPSFSGELWANFASVVHNCENGYKSLKEFVAFLKERIRIERLHCKNLARLSRATIGKGEFGTLAAAMDRLRVDATQGSNERMSFAAVLETDVLPEILEMKALYEKMNGKLILEGKKVSKALSDARERINSRADADESTLSKLQGFATLTSKFKSASPVKNSSNGFSADKLKSAEALYSDVMTSVLEGIQSNEEARIRCLRGALRKCVVFETSLVANRSYDIKDMAAVMEDIDHSEVLNQFISSVQTQAQPARSPRPAAVCLRVLEVLSHTLSSGVVDNEAMLMTDIAYKTLVNRPPKYASVTTDEDTICLNYLSVMVNDVGKVSSTDLDDRAFRTICTAFRLVFATLFDFGRMEECEQWLKIAEKIGQIHDPADGTERGTVISMIIQSPEYLERAASLQAWKEAKSLAFTPTEANENAVITDENCIE